MVCLAGLSAEFGKDLVDICFDLLRSSFQVTFIDEGNIDDGGLFEVGKDHRTELSFKG